MLRHPPLQRLLLRALARSGAATGGTSSIPVAVASAEARGPFPGALLGWKEEHQASSFSPLLQQQRGFASRGPSFLDPQGRRAMKQKRQAKQRQRLLRDMKGGSSVVAVGGSGDAAAVAVAARRRAAAAAAAEAEATAAAASNAPAPEAAATAASAPSAASSSPRPPPPPSRTNASDDGGPEDDDTNAPGTPIEMQREQSSWLPGWMRSIMPESLGGGFGGSGAGHSSRSCRRQQQEAASQQQQQSDNNAPATSSTAANNDDDDGRYANLEKYRDLNLEAFLQHQGEQSDDAPPPPRPPPNRRVPQLSPLRRAYQSDESRRVLYYRARHHVRIVEALREDERAIIEADPRAAVRRERLLRSVAARTGYSPGQVADCLQAYESLRFRVNALCDWRAAGRRMPNSQAELTAVVEAARRERDDQDLAVLLAERRTPGERCPLKPGHLSALGGRRRAVCPQTRLPYGECCGALEGVGGDAGGGGKQQQQRAML